MLRIVGMILWMYFVWISAETKQIMQMGLSIVSQSITIPHIMHWDFNWYFFRCHRHFIKREILWLRGMRFSFSFDFSFLWWKELVRVNEFSATHSTAQNHHLKAFLGTEKAPNYPLPPSYHPLQGLFFMLSSVNKCRVWRQIKLQHISIHVVG